jgi:hypothetical protein
MNRLLVAGALVLSFSQAAVAAQAVPAPAVVPAATTSANDPAAAAFRDWDKNGDGRLSRMEFDAGWRQAQTIARAKVALERQFLAVDANRNRAIDAGEYGHLVLVKGAGKNAPPLARFDANANGKLEFAEYVGLVETLAPRRNAGSGAKK